MITRHYKRIVKDILQRGGAKYDAYAVTASDGRPYYTAQEQPNYSADQTAMSMSTDQPGVIIGSGTAAESETSYWLAQQITSGFSGSVLPTHEMVDGTHALCLYVTIANTGNSSITISEIGYALITPLMRRPSDSQYIGSPYAVEKNVLIDRTVLASPITIAAGNSVRLKYALKTTDEIFSGSVVLIQKTISANGVYNASSDNADGYSEVTVSVIPNLQSKTATQNGTVTPDQGYDGLSSVVVNVSGGSAPVLPSEYQEVEYLECYGNQFITEANVNPSSGDIIHGYASLDASVDSAVEDGALGGGAANTYWISFQNGTILYNGGISGTTISNIERDVMYELLGTFTRSGQNFTIGRYYGTIRHTGKIKKIEIINGRDGVTRYRIYVPCYQKSNNKPGFYDLIRGKFYTNSGTSDFGLGPDVL